MKGIKVKKCLTRMLMHLQPTGGFLLAAHICREQLDQALGECCMLINKYFTAALLASVCAITTLAMAAPNNNVRDAYLDSFGQQQGMTVLQALASVFQQFDREGDGIETVDLDFFESIQNAASNANLASQWLRYDLNGNLSVSRQEVEEMLGSHQFGMSANSMNERQKKQIAAQLKKNLDEMFANDLDGNGSIEGVELYRPTNKARDDRSYRQGYMPFAKAMLKADPNRDGKLTQAEAASIAGESLDGVDDELAKIFVEKRNAQSQGTADSCPKIDVAKDSSVILFGTYESTSLASVTVAGQDNTTYGSNIFIEDGSTSLTLILTSYNPMIWRFSGATQRISKLVVSAPSREQSEGKVPAGVTGIDRGKIQFIKGNSCLHYFSEVNSAEALIAKTMAGKMSGKSVGIVFANYDVETISLPSGLGSGRKVSKVDKLALKQKSGAQYFTVGANGELTPIGDEVEKFRSNRAERDLFQFNPSGLMQFKASEVVSDATAEPYIIYPENAGLLQLEAQKKIEAMQGDSHGWKINAAIRFPAGLAGAVSTGFFLPKGVPEPEGDPGHSCVFSEEAGGTLNKGIVCFN